MLFVCIFCEENFNRKRDLYLLFLILCLLQNKYIVIILKIFVFIKIEEGVIELRILYCNFVFRIDFVLNYEEKKIVVKYLFGK